MNRQLVSIILLILSVFSLPLSAQKAPDPGALAAALASLNLQKMEELIARGADADQADAGGETPLIYAVSLGRFDLVNRLLDVGADPDKPGKNGLSPLMTAVQNSREDLVLRLLSSGADVNQVGDFTGMGRPIPVSAFSLAVNRGEFALADRLFDFGADPRRTGISGESVINPLNLPLLDIPLDSRIWQDRAYMKASSESPDWDASVESGDPWILHRAARDNSWTEARAILDGGMSPDRVDERGLTPLMVAARHGNQAMVSLFLQRGADPGIVDFMGRDALCYAASEGREEILISLIEVLESSNEAGRASYTELRQSPLYFAVISSLPGSVSILLESGLSPEGYDDEGVTILMMAAWLGNTRTVALVMDSLDGSILDNSGRTALDWCAAAFDRDRATGRETGDPGRSARHYPIARILASRLKNPAEYGVQPTRDMHPVVIQSWSPGSNPLGSDQWRNQRPSPVPLIPGDGDLTLHRILRDEEPGIPSGS